MRFVLHIIYQIFTLRASFEETDKVVILACFKVYLKGCTGPLRTKKQILPVTFGVDQY